MKWPPFFVEGGAKRGPSDKEREDSFIEKIEPLSRREAEVLWFMEMTEGKADALDHIAVRDLNQSIFWSSTTEDLTPTMASTAVLWVRGRARDCRLSRMANNAEQDGGGGDGGRG